jgi:hypothetical protein
VAKIDPMVELFSHLFESIKLVDVEHVKIFPIWRNLRKGNLVI